MIEKSASGELLWSLRARGAGRPPDDMYLWAEYADSFLRSGVLLLGVAEAKLDETWQEQNSGDIDSDWGALEPHELVVPALYHIRHGVELLLKLLCVCKAPSTLTAVKANGHDLAKLLARAEPLMSHEAGAVEYMDSVRALVEFFHELDSQGDGLRYPTLGNLKNLPPVLLSEQRFSLTALRDATKHAAMLRFTADIEDSRAWHE